MLEDNGIVKVHYVGYFDDGEVFDTSEGLDPLEFKLGQHRVIQGFEDAVREMSVGEKKTITVPPEKAYGFYDESKVIPMMMASVPNASDFEIGKQVYIQKEGMQVTTRLLRVENGMGFFDFNLPLAGRSLNFDIELIDYRPSDA